VTGPVAAGSAVPPRRAVKREYGLTLLAGAAGAALILLAVRQQWARAVFTPPKPLSAQVVSVSGSDLVPLAGALALAALAGLAAVIATRGVLRRVAGGLVALFGAGAGAAVLTSVTAAGVVSVAASKVASPGTAAISGAAGSTTSGSAGGGAFVVSGSAGQAVMTGMPWHVAVLAGAVLVFLAGLLTARRGPDWPVMSSRYDAPAGRGSRGPGAQAAGSRGTAGTASRARALDAATMWESLNGGVDPTTDPDDDGDANGAGAAGDAPGDPPSAARPEADQAAGRPGGARGAGAR
jgi:uncharacterized membrane protein (TIGR02234 family)